MWEHGLKICFEQFVEHFQKCPRSVNNFRIDHLFLRFVGILGPEWSPSAGVGPVPTRHVPLMSD